MFGNRRRATTSKLPKALQERARIRIVGVNRGGLEDQLLTDFLRILRVPRSTQVVGNDIE